MASLQEAPKAFSSLHRDISPSTEILRPSSIGVSVPGQGNQYVEMHEPLYGMFPEAKAVWEMTADIVGSEVFDVLQDKDRLDNTRWIQVVMTASSMAREKVRQSRNILPEASITAGKSVGEIAAIWIAGGMSDEDAIVLANERGKISEAQPEGAMMVITNIDEETRKRMEGLGVIPCIEVTQNKQTFGAGQDGYDEAMQYFMSLPENNGWEYNKENKKPLVFGEKGKVYPLFNINRVFHHPHMEGMVNPLAEVLSKKVTLYDIPDEATVIGNTTAMRIRTASDIRAELLAQPVKPVLWEQSLREMVKSGMSTMLVLDNAPQLASEAQEIFKDSSRARTTVGNGDGEEALLGHLWDLPQSQQQTS